MIMIIIVMITIIGIMIYIIIVSVRFLVSFYTVYNPYP